MARIQTLCEKIIFDFDDAILLKDSNHLHSLSLSRRLKLQRICKRTDLLITGNSFLADHLRDISSKVLIIPIGSALCEPLTEKQKVTLGWI